MIGAGPAGLCAARRLRENEAVAVTLVAPGGVARHHAGLLDVLTGGAAAEEFTFAIALDRVEVVDHAVSAVDEIAGDAVVVAAGLELAPVPEAPGVCAVWDLPTAAASRLDPEGPVAVVVAGLPYRCPPAPYSLAMRLAAAGRDVTVVTPDAVPLGGVGGPAPDALRDAWTAAGVRVETGFEVDLAAGLDRAVVARDGRRVTFAAAVVVPPHRPPAWADERPEGLPVFAAGDVVLSPLPRAAGVAEAQGITAAEAVLAAVGLEPARRPRLPSPVCALDHGDGRFSRIAITFPDGLPPSGRPSVRVDGPSKALASVARDAAARLRDLAQR